MARERGQLVCFASLRQDVCALFVQLGLAHQDQRDKEGETVVDVFRRRPSRTEIKCLPPVTTDTQDNTFLKMAISSRDGPAVPTVSAHPGRQKLHACSVGRAWEGASVASATCWLLEDCHAKAR